MGINLDPKVTNITWFGGDTSAVPLPTGDGKISEQLSFLSQKMDVVARRLDYWDIYKFEDSINNSQDLGNAIARLNPNHALVINTNMDINNDISLFNFINSPNQQLHRGDVILKQDNGSLIHIPSKSAGILYPATWDSDSNAITLQYAATLDDILTSTAGSNAITYQQNENGVIESSPLTITITEPSLAYSFESSNTTDSFDALEQIPNQPIVKTFITSTNGSGDSVYEELIVDISLTSNGSQYTYNILDTIPSALSIKVIAK